MSEKKPYILVIGAANIDFVGISNNPLIWHDKNPGKIKTSLGGVGRNIAENLAKLGIKTKLLSLVGDDIYGDTLINETKKSGVDVSLVRKIPKQSSSVYFSLMDSNDDIAIAISDMDIINLLSPSIIKENEAIIHNAELVILDTNLTIEALTYLLTNFPQTHFLVDPVSVNKVNKIKELTSYIDILKPNNLEAEYLTGIPIKTVEDAFLAIDELIKQGIKRVFLSFGNKGLVYGDVNCKKHITAYKINVLNATGAGDSMMASIAYGVINKLPVDDLIIFASSAAALTLTAESTIHPKFSINEINKFIMRGNYEYKITTIPRH